MTTYKQQPTTHKTNTPQAPYRADVERAIIQSVANKRLAILAVIRAEIAKAAK